MYQGTPNREITLNARSSATKVSLYFKKPVTVECCQALITIKKEYGRGRTELLSSLANSDWSSLINLWVKVLIFGIYHLNVRHPYIFNPRGVRNEISILSG